MAYRTIKQWPHKCLSTKAEAANLEEIQWVSTDLIDTLKIIPGAGLAAPQINILKKVFVIDTSRFGAVNPDAEIGDSNYWVVANPKFSEPEGEWKWEEACLSVPLAKLSVTRCEKIVMEYDDVSGKRKKMDLEPPLSLACQHEADHLEGKTIFDRANKFAADMCKRKIRKSILRASRKAREEEKYGQPTVGRTKKKSHLSSQEIKKRKKSRKRNLRKK